LTDLIGHTIDRYHILEQLGQGGMATVYKAYDTRLQRDVAIKIIRTDLFGSSVMERLIKRFELEAKTLATLNHEHIVKVFDFGEYEGTPYLVMDYLPGTTLKQLMTAPIPWQKSFELLLPIASALAYAHDHQVLHRDIKPSNILLTTTNKTYLSDFGIAKVLKTEEEHTLTGTGVGVGTPEYMAPEQGMGKKVDERVDIYAFGVVLYEMITGEKPYSADTPMAVLLKHISDPVPRANQRIKDLPEAVEKILIKAMAKDPDNRFQSMQVMISAMQKALHGQEDEVLDTDLFSSMGEIGDLEGLETIDFHPLDKDSPAPVVMDGKSHPSTSNKGSNRKRWFAIGSALVILVMLFLVGQRFLNGDRGVAIDPSGDSMPTHTVEDTPNQEVEPEDLVVSADTNQITNNPTMSPSAEFDATPVLSTEMVEEPTEVPTPTQDDSPEKITAENFSQLEMLADISFKEEEINDENGIRSILVSEDRIYISPSTKYIIHSKFDADPVIYKDLRTGNVMDFPLTDNSSQLRLISPNDNYLFFDNNEKSLIQIFNLISEEITEEIIGTIHTISRDGHWVLAEESSENESKLLLINANTLSRTIIWEGDNQSFEETEISIIHSAPDGRSLIVELITKSDTKLLSYKADSLSPTIIWSGKYDSISINRTGDHLLIKNNDYLYIQKNQNIIQTIEVDNYDGFGISYDNVAIFGADTKSLRIWDVNTGEIIRTFYGDRKFYGTFFIDNEPIVVFRIPVGEASDTSITTFDYLKNEIICQIGIHNGAVYEISNTSYFNFIDVTKNAIVDTSNKCQILYEAEKHERGWTSLGDNLILSLDEREGGVTNINLYNQNNFEKVDSVGLMIENYSFFGINNLEQKILQIWGIPNSGDVLDDYRFVYYGLK